ncbi:MAG: hypothetical protein HY791_14720 [Deltaproteobacteria bacterium]|nr:hypothetical protein [Deltaproteobacteria bacterium]
MSLRKLPLRIAPSLVCLSALACGNVSELNVTLSFTSAEIEDTTTQVMLVVQLPPKDGDPCAPLWADPPAALGQPFVRLVDYPNATDLLAAGLADERYAIFAYAHATQFDLFCKNSGECAGSSVGRSCHAIGGGQQACVASDRAVSPLAAGCAVGTVGLETAPIRISLAPR